MTEAVQAQIHNVVHQKLNDDMLRQQVVTPHIQFFGDLPCVHNVNLPDQRKSRFGEELNAEKMKKAVWVQPQVVVQIEFLEWTDADRLRHSKFAGLRDGKDPRTVVKEHAIES